MQRSKIHPVLLINMEDTGEDEHCTEHSVLTAGEDERTWMFIHWKVVQLQLALCVYGQPAKRTRFSCNEPLLLCSRWCKFTFRFSKYDLDGIGGMWKEEQSFSYKSVLAATYWGFKYDNQLVWCSFKCEKRLNHKASAHVGTGDGKEATLPFQFQLVLCNPCKMLLYVLPWSFLPKENIGHETKHLCNIMLILRGFFFDLIESERREKVFCFFTYSFNNLQNLKNMLKSFLGLKHIEHFMLCILLDFTSSLV